MWHLPYCNQKFNTKSQLDSPRQPAIISLYATDARRVNSLTRQVVRHVQLSPLSVLAQAATVHLACPLSLHLFAFNKRVNSNLILGT